MPAVAVYNIPALRSIRVGARWTFTWRFRGTNIDGTPGGVLDITGRIYELTIRRKASDEIVVFDAKTPGTLLINEGDSGQLTAELSKEESSKLKTFADGVWEYGIAELIDGEPELILIGTIPIDWSIVR